VIADLEKCVCLLLSRSHYFGKTFPFFLMPLLELLDSKNGEPKSNAERLCSRGCWHSFSSPRSWTGAKSAAARVNARVERASNARSLNYASLLYGETGLRRAERASHAWQRAACFSSLQNRCVRGGLAASDGTCDSWGSSRLHDGRCKPLSCGSTRRQRTPSSSSPWRPASIRCAHASMHIGHLGPTSVVSDTP
jgi:hypothetical protein